MVGKIALGNGGGESLGVRSFLTDELLSLGATAGTGEREDDLDASFLEDATDGESFLSEKFGDNWRFVVLVFTPDGAGSTLSNDCWGGNGGGDSLGDLILIAASSRVRGRAGEGDLLDTGD